MERIQVTDEWLYRYMPVAAEALLEDMEKEIDYKYEFTSNFEKKMKRLMRWERRRNVRNKVYKVGRKYVHIAAAAIMLLFLFSMSIEACRIAFFDTIKTVGEDSFLYQYIADGREDEKPEPHAPAYIPEGYALVEENVMEVTAEYIYENREGVLLICQQEMIIEDRTVVYDDEYDEKIYLSLNGYSAEIYRYGDDTGYAYFEFGSSVYTIYSEQLSVEDIEQILLHWVWE